MGDFLLFKAFIAQDVLIVAYYVGAVGMPFVLWVARDKLTRRFAMFGWIDQQGQLLFQQLSSRNKKWLLLLGVFVFIALEIIWRMMFEAMIGYFQIHDFLRQMTATV